MTDNQTLLRARSMGVKRAVMLSAALILLGATGLAAPEPDPKSQGTEKALETATAPRITGKFAAFNPASRVVVNAGDYGSFITATTVNDRKARLVAFQSMDLAAREVLDAYIERMQRIPVSRLNRDEQLAYWLNLHNALTIKILADDKGKRPIDSYRGFPNSDGKAFSQPIVTVEGVKLSVDQIVNDVIRAEFKDPTALYGVFTGAKGSAPLLDVPYKGSEIRQQLAAQAAAFINEGDAVRIKSGKLELSKFYEWYGDDFGGQSAVLQQISDIASPKLKAKLAATQGVAAYRYNYELAAYIPRESVGSGDFSGFGRGSGGGGFGGGGFGGGGGGGGGS